MPYLQKEMNREEVVWFHCASLGEFEQGRPLMEQMKVDYPKTKILLTFFSPSGYEIRKDYEGADYVCYLPMDRPKAIRQFLAQVNPKMVIFIKYEYWFLLLRSLHQGEIPVFFVSAIVKKGHFLTKAYSAPFRKILKKVKHFYVQDDFSRKQFHSMGIEQVTVVGDTRVDRVVTLAQKVKPFPLVKKWVKNHRVLICGSTWEKDEDLILMHLEKMVLSGWKVILAPHEVGQSNIRRLTKRISSDYFMMSNLITDSQLVKGDYLNKNILIVDSIGQLNSLYQYGDVAYIGGGFTASGIHNTLEPATFGLPLLFGPNYKGFVEAVYFVNNNGAFVIDAHNKSRLMDKLEAQDWQIEARIVNKNYIATHKGAAKKIAVGLYEYL